MVLKRLQDIIKSISYIIPMSSTPPYSLLRVCVQSCKERNIAIAFLSACFFILSVGPSETLRHYVTTVKYIEEACLPLFRNPDEVIDEGGSKYRRSI